MPDHLAALNLTAEAVEVLKGSGIESLADLAGANVTYLQSTFIAAAQEGRYPEKFLSLVKIAAWVEQARTLSEQQPEGGPSTNLDNIPTAVVVAKRPQKKAYGGSGVKSAAGTMELRPDRHRRVKRDPEAAPPPAATGERVVVTPRGEEAAPQVATELNPETSRRLHERRQSPTLQSSKTTPAQPPAVGVQPQTVLPSVPGPSAPAPAPAPALEFVPEQESSAGSAQAPPPPAFRTFEDYKGGRTVVKPLDRHSLSFGEDASRSSATEQDSFEEELAYKKRMPIWRIRGVKHPDGLKVYITALITFIAIVLTLATVIIGVIFPFYPELEDYRMEFGGLFLVTLFFGVLYLFSAIGMRCRVCSCHLYYSRRCHKNKKAHRILGGFPMFAQVLHILLWRWFWCMYCGTAVRLTEDSANHDYDE
ncbi:hypothetical protein OAV21_01855 [bacterium]|nr:hypothetical protein [bacterium]MDC0312373.1 hypothetical protein [Verrucomicrobiales bacterium]MDC0503606.1 hypothetical protein [Verrucomicrobiales bacterium]MDC3255125.1 hypothetical protein [bacterium]MDF1787498.1 hypothetical protein [Verrucomicrobiales bacterium]